MPSFRSPLPTPELFPSFFWGWGYTPSPQFLDSFSFTFLKHCKKDGSCTCLQNFPSRAFSVPPGPEQELMPTGATPEQKGRDQSSRPLESITPPPPLRLQPIRCCPGYYANNPSCPSQSGDPAPSLQHPLSPQPRQKWRRRPWQPERRQFSPAQRLKKKKKKTLKWFLVVTWEGSGWAWPGRRRTASPLPRALYQLQSGTGWRYWITCPGLILLLENRSHLVSKQLLSTFCRLPSKYAQFSVKASSGIWHPPDFLIHRSNSGAQFRFFIPPRLPSSATRKSHLAGLSPNKCSQMPPSVSFE